MDVILEPALEGDVEAVAADGASGGDGVTQLSRVGFVAGVREQRLEGAAEHGLRRAAHRPRRRPVHVGAAPVAVVERDVIAERIEDVEKTLGSRAHRENRAKYSAVTPLFADWNPDVKC